MALGYLSMGMTNGDVEERVQDIERALQDLADELGDNDLETSRGKRRSVTGFVQDVAIPAGMLAVEAQVRTLAFVSERVRRVNQRAGDQSSLDDWSDEAREHSVATMDRIDELLDRIERELDAGRLPASAEARDLIGEIRRLQAEVREQVAQGSTASDGLSRHSEAVTIDVESELETIKDEVDAEDRNEE